MKKLLVFSVIFGLLISTAGLVFAGNGLQAQEEGAMFQLWDLAPAILGYGNTVGTAERTQAGDTNREGQAEHLFLYPKDPENNWEPIYDAEFGRAIFDLDCGEETNKLTMNLYAYMLEPTHWYYVELNDKCAEEWTVIDEWDASRRNRFYGQADSAGYVNIDFEWDIDSEIGCMEVNMKNADNVALLDPSTYGVTSEWIIGTGQGWDYVLYALDTIPNTCEE